MELFKNVMFSKDETNGGALTAEEIAEKEKKERDENEEEKLDEDENKENENKEIDNLVNKEGEDKEDKITLTKAELEEIKKQKYAEGARKATKTAQNPEADILAIQEELTQLRAEKIASKIVDSKYQEDLVAIAKGKGLEITESNLKEIVKKYPEWLISNQEEHGTIIIGGPSGTTKIGPLNEKEQARKLFGNK